MPASTALIAAQQREEATRIQLILTIYNMVTVFLKVTLGATAWQEVGNQLEDDLADVFSSDYFFACAKIGSSAAATVFAVATAFAVIESRIRGQWFGEATLWQRTIDNFKLFLAAFVLDFLWQPFADLTEMAIEEGQFGLLVGFGLFGGVNAGLFGGIGRLTGAGWATPDIVGEVAAGTVGFEVFAIQHQLFRPGAAPDPFAAGLATGAMAVVGGGPFVWKAADEYRAARQARIAAIPAAQGENGHTDAAGEGDPLLGRTSPSPSTRTGGGGLG